MVTTVTAVVGLLATDVDHASGGARWRPCEGHHLGVEGAPYQVHGLDQLTTTAHLLREALATELLHSP